jgi:hypothetical protein
MKIAEDGDFGLYLWKMPNGKYFGNGEGDFLLIPARRNDLKAMTDLYHAAKHYGAVGGNAVFVANAREVTQSEQEDQMERMLDGKLPDPYDVGALMDEARAKHEQS